MEKQVSKAIVWVRHDLRWTDHPALEYAAQRASEVILVYIYEGENGGDFAVGGASKWWLHHALIDFQKEVSKRGGELLILKGKPLDLFPQLLESSAAEAVFWNRRYEPDAISVDSEVKAALKEFPIEVKSFRGNVLNEPQDIENKTGKPYQVFTPYWKNARLQSVRTVKKCDVHIGSPEPELSVSELNLLSGFQWWGEMKQYWDPTLVGVSSLLKG